MKKVIWYIYPYAGGPGVGQVYRPYHLAKHWKKMGHDPVIIAASYHHVLANPEGMPEGYFTKSDVPYYFVPAQKYKGNGLGRIKNMFGFSWNLSRHFDRLAEAHGKPDIVVSSSPHPFPYHAAVRLRKRYGAKIIFEMRDLWPLTPLELMNTTRLHPFIAYISLLERYIYRTCDAAVSLLPNACDYMVGKGLKRGKFHYIPNGMCVESLVAGRKKVSSALLDKMAAWKAEGKFIVAYTGMHGETHAVEYIVDAGKILQGRGRKDIMVLLVGGGAKKPELKEYAKTLGIGNVYFADPVERPELENVLALSDACIVTARNKDLYKYGMSPIKFYEYLGASKPVIWSINASNTPVTDAGCGLTIGAENAGAIADAIVGLAGLEEQERTEMGKRGFAYLSENHDYAVLAQKYTKLF